MEFIKLYDKIHVYKNLFTDLDKMIYDFKNIENEETQCFKNWEPWYTFGRQRGLQMSEDEKFNGKLHKYGKQLNEILDSTTKHFMKYYNIEVENSYPTSGHLCEYKPIQNNDDIKTKMTMTYHVDYQQEKIGEPGSFHYVTCNMYLNDDYHGGEICFSINDDKFEYKPVAGDVIVFPSTPPYYHGVKKTYGSPKYFFRTFIMKDEQASEDWLKGKEKYGLQMWNEIRISEQKNMRQKFIKHQDYQEPNVKLEY
jgi:hypothetical protein